MITVYGTPLCRDCLAMKIIFEQRHVDYQYINITENTANLRAFLQIREDEPMFAEYRRNSGIGVPFFMKDDRKSFDVNEALSWEGIAPVDENEIKRITEECVLLCK